MKSLKPGDYVLATKYSDGSPGDHWCIGFYKSFNADHGRHYIVDERGVSFRAGGFRRAQKISGRRGDFILARKDLIEQSGATGRGLWWWVSCSMKYETPAIFK